MGWFIGSWITCSEFVLSRMTGGDIKYYKTLYNGVFILFIGGGGKLYIYEEKKQFIL